MKPTKAFTLIEIMVVVVIIAILTGMLLAVINIVRKQAHVLDCGNRQRQIGVALMVFAGDHKGRLPAPAEQRVSTVGTAGQIPWNILLMTVMDLPDRMDIKTFVCPLDKESPHRIYDDGVTRIGGRRSFSVVTHPWWVSDKATAQRSVPFWWDNWSESAPLNSGSAHVAKMGSNNILISETIQQDRNRFDSLWGGATFDAKAFVSFHEKPNFIMSDGRVTRMWWHEGAPGCDQTAEYAYVWYDFGAAYTLGGASRLAP